MRALLDILTRYEGAVQEANTDGDDDAVVAELESARTELMEVLQLARSWEETNQTLIQNQIDGGTNGSVVTEGTAEENRGAQSPNPE